MMVFEGINSKVLTRIYDILFIDEANRQKVMINVTSKYKDSTTFSFRSKNKKAGQTAAAIAKIGGPLTALYGENFSRNENGQIIYDAKTGLPFLSIRNFIPFCFELFDLNELFYKNSIFN